MELKNIVADVLEEYLKVDPSLRMTAKIETIIEKLDQKYREPLVLPDIEYITCPAIHFDDGKEYGLQPSNIKTGIVLCGWRHGCIFPQIGGLVKERQELGIYEKEQGFITNRNRFVDRKEAGLIAYSAKQTKELIETLHSEDLY